MTATLDNRERTFFGQPRALANLFGVELWERFSFYGMQGILLIYLYYEASRGGLGIDQDTATSIVGAYGGSVYLATVVGAWLADRMFGPERVLFGSAVLVMCGHLGLALIPGLTGVAIGLAQYAIGRRNLPDSARTIANPLPRRRLPLVVALAGVAIALIAVLALTGLLPAAHLSTIVVVLSILVAIAYFAVILTSHRV